MPHSIRASSIEAPIEPMEAQAEEISGQVGLPQELRLGLVRHLWRRKTSLVGLVGLVLIALIAILAPVISPHDPIKQDLTKVLQPPFWMEGGTWVNPLGTDPLGRDLLTRLIWGARTSLLISLGAVIMGSSIGFILGLISGFFGGWVDTILMRLGDIQLSFPFVLFALAILGVSPERSPLNLIVVLGLASWVIYARVVRSRVLAERGKDYARVARALGSSRTRVLFRYILPNVWQAVPLIGMLDLGFLVIVESMLSFLALGLTPPTSSWGLILADGKQYMMIAPWMAFFPGAAILLTVLCINLAADGLTDYIDPKLGKSSFRRSILRFGGPSTLGASESRLPPVLSVRGLNTVFPMQNGIAQAVKDVTFDLQKGQVLGIVGESGSGKSTLGLSIIQLLDSPGRVTSGEIFFEGKDLTRISDAEMAAVRGKKLGMIFQNPGASLNPVLTVGFQLIETIRRFQKVSSEEAYAQAKRALVEVGIADPPRVLNSYPFELSGGMQQRAMIALAMVNQPDLLIADEPTTALDVTTQAQLLERLEELRSKSGATIIFITHDIALLSDFADVIMIMYAGEICEIGPRQQVIQNPRHPYTQALLNSVARVDVPEGTRLAAIPGDPPDLTQTRLGCPFAARCPQVMSICRKVDPAMTQVAEGHQASCHLIKSSDLERGGVL